MKKILKSLSVVLISLTLMFAVAQPVLAKDNAGSIVNSVEATNVSTDTSEVNKIANTVINWLWIISIIVTIIVLMVIGLKYIIGSTQEKAEYKKSLIPLVVGALLIVFATTIVKFLFAGNK